jgi:dTDP-4-dehydrorhamnose reductase
VRIVVFGPNNSIGAALCNLGRQQGHEMIAADREAVDYIDLTELHRFLKAQKPNMVINVAMLVPPKSRMTEVVLINSYFPHLLKEVTMSLDIPMIQLSSDSVFSGHAKLPNTVRTNPDPTTYFGKSRALGEVVASNVCVVRTAWLWRDASMVKWLLSVPANGQIDGWTSYMWSGSTLREVVLAILGLCIKQPFTPGIHHLSTVRAVSKYDIIMTIQTKLGLSLRVNPVEHPALNRVLEPTIILKPLEEAIYADDSFANLCAQPA